MSSTNRGAIRHESDFYETPEYCVIAFLHKLRKLSIHTNVLIPENVLEPCAGHGAIIRAFDKYRSTVLGAPPPQWTAIEIREEAQKHLEPWNIGRDRAYIQDFLTWKPLNGERFDLCITNPPFDLALPIIEHAMTMADIVAMLLRVNFVGSQKRSEWHRDHPSDLGVLDCRPSFKEDGSTDSIEYGWFIWDAFEGGGRWFIIPCANFKPKRKKK